MTIEKIIIDRQAAQTLADKDYIVGTYDECEALIEKMDWREYQPIFPLSGRYWDDNIGEGEWVGDLRYVDENGNEWFQIRSIEPQWSPFRLIHYLKDEDDITAVEFHECFYGYTNDVEITKREYLEKYADLPSFFGWKKRDSSLMRFKKSGK